MQKASRLLTLALVVALATAPAAWAQRPGGSSGGSGYGGSSGTAPGAGPSTAPGAPGHGATERGAGPSASPASGDFMGRHTMTGEVTQIDNRSGKFSLRTSEGTLELHAPPSALSGVKQGDRMSVEIAVRPMR
jgi:hypothetical protein